MKLPNKNLLQENRMDIYDWFAGGRAPKEWIVGRNRTAAYTCSACGRVKEENTQLAY